MYLVLAALALATEVIVDDEDGAPGFTTTSSDWDTWSLGSDGYDSGDTSYHYLTAYEGDGLRMGTATWSPDLPVAGTWQVDTWFRRTSNRTDDADHSITDRDGSTHVVVDQTGDGASGWVSLGTYSCAAGRGGCSVLLDGDDGESDEANAVRFTLVAEDTGETTTETPCAEVLAPGSYTWSLPATSATASDWEDANAATGAPDGAEAHTENVDAGEYLRASGWAACDPPGDEVITGVRLNVYARTQYDSGQYDVQLALTDGALRTTFHGTSAAWTVLDLTSEGWTWAEIAAIEATVELDSHPGGERDSDAWVDGFTVDVDFTVPEAAPEDTGVGGTDTAGPTETGEVGDTATDTASDTASDTALDTATTSDPSLDTIEAAGTPGDPVPLGDVGCSGGLMLLGLLPAIRRR